MKSQTLSKGKLNLNVKPYDLLLGLGADVADVSQDGVDLFKLIDMISYGVDAINV